MKKIDEIDWLGIGLLALAVGTLQFVLERGHEEDWFEMENYIEQQLIASIISSKETP
jgi:hypothetical protein